MPLNPPQDYRKTEFTHRIGLASARPSAADVLIGTLYFSSDTFILERSNGVIWSLYGGGSGISSLTSSIGPSGIDGLDGEDSIPGIQGPTGPQGSQGIQGIQGPLGLSLVEDGIDGIDGWPSSTGLQGAAGSGVNDAVIAAHIAMRV